MADTRYIVIDPNGSTVEVKLCFEVSTGTYIGEIKGVVADASRTTGVRVLQPERIRDFTEEGSLTECRKCIRHLVGERTQWFEARGDKTDRGFYAGSSIFRIQCVKYTAGRPGQLGLFKHWKIYDSVPMEKGEFQLVWYDNSRPGVVVNRNDYLGYFRARQRVDPLRKIRACEVVTERAAFDLKVYSDARRTEFLACFDGFTPGTLPTVEPGQRYPKMELIKEEALRGTDESQLIEKCKERIAELGGQLEYFIDHRSWETWERSDFDGDACSQFGTRLFRD